MACKIAGHNNAYHIVGQ